MDSELEIPDKKLTRSKITRSKTDAAWKHILDLYLKQFLELCWPEAYHDIDWNKSYEFLEQEMLNINSFMSKNIVDKLIKVFLKNGIEQWILIHLEVQGACEKFFVKRMYVYNYRIYDHYQKSVASMAILLDSNKNWRPNTFQNNILGCSVQIKFPILKLLDFKNKEQELLASNNPFGIIIIAPLRAIESGRNENLKLANKKEIAKKCSIKMVFQKMK